MSEMNKNTMEDDDFFADPDREAEEIRDNIVRNAKTTLMLCPKCKGVMHSVKLSAQNEMQGETYLCQDCGFLPSQDYLKTRKITLFKAGEYYLYNYEKIKIIYMERLFSQIEFRDKQRMMLSNAKLIELKRFRKGKNLVPATFKGAEVLSSIKKDHDLPDYECATVYIDGKEIALEDLTVRFYNKPKINFKKNVLKKNKKKKARL